MFHKSAATKLIDMISRVKERGKMPYWILDDQYKILVEYWGTEKAKERSKKASKSRMSDRNGLGPHKHRAGSRSYAKVADLLKEKTGDASYIDVLRETHKKPDGSFVDERAKQISEGFEKNVADLFEDEIPPTEELTHDKKNELYLKIVEATNGRVFGLGALLSEFSVKGGVSAIFENHVENEAAFKQKLEELYQENLEIKERLNKLEGLEKMLELLCPRLSSTGVNN
ncbi:putative transposase Ptta/En/Spm plant [Arabidopsis thaliana x Arabidopsis arenosa]|uniref:Putative transposase Ptta/En/Spm plant n=1 Tax=Arabidopsis thaliana x Arabidopsis arenosa TaxID=1240361 RepID=A0A8T1ZRQ6_9BRAS|nr:putative transposase Ptta/En/Spm plant [Arabidopsis thaliana x Arabidopsis arenosa]